MRNKTSTFHTRNIFLDEIPNEFSSFRTEIMIMTNDNFTSSTITTIDCNSSTTTREPYRTITLVLLRIYPIVFLLIGTIGNLLSVYVVLRSKLRRYSTFTYLAFLSIVDLIVLYTFAINFLLHAWWNIDLQQVSLAACKIYSFSIYFFPQASAWILTAVSIDRVLALTRGIRKPRKTRITYTTLLVIFLILFPLNVQFLFYDNTYQMDEVIDDEHGHKYRIVDTDMDINVVQCSLENIEEYAKFYRNVWVYVDGVVNVYLPFALMFLCSTIIFLNVLRTMGNANNSKKRLVARNLSTMLLSINTMFVFLTAPIVIYLMFEKQLLSSNSSECHIRVKAKFKMIKLFFIILMNANHTGNILVYCLTGTEFRTQLFHVLGTTKNFQELSSNRSRQGTLNKENILRVSMRKHGDLITSKIQQRPVGGGEKISFFLDYLFSSMSIVWISKKIHSVHDVHHVMNDDIYSQNVVYKLNRQHRLVFKRSTKSNCAFFFLCLTVRMSFILYD